MAFSTHYRLKYSFTGSKVHSLNFFTGTFYESDTILNWTHCTEINICDH